MNGFPVKLTWPAWYWLSAAAFLVFLLLSWYVLALAPHAFDMRCAIYLKGHAESHIWLRNTFRFITLLGEAQALGTLAGSAIAWLLLRKKRFLAAVWLLATGGGALLNLGMKSQFDRSRPPPVLRDASVEHLTSLSYPSGHAMGATVGLGMCVYVVLGRVQRGPLRGLVAAALILLIFLIGFSRIYLRAHWFSDVFGGFMVGTAWLLFCVGVYQSRRNRQTVPLPEDELEPEEEMC